MNDREDQMPQRANYIRDLVAEDVARGKFGGLVVTRFAPEPNGYMHIGHAYAARISHDISREFGGKFNLRFDDTNPITEKYEYVEAMLDGLKWLGIDWDNMFFASDYFPKMYEYARQLVGQGQAYVCELAHETMRQQRGTLTNPGIESPYRNRPVDENLELLEAMREGDISPGRAVLRAKIDMAAPNLLMRDPVMYRILHASHFRQGDTWSIYPTYDWAHCLEDSIEGITHSLCSIEFDNNRALYDWYLDQLGIHHPKQIEFSRLNLSHTVMSKRKLIQLVTERRVFGWDDPRIPTISAFRRRGLTPDVLNDFLRQISVSRAPLMVDVTLLEYCARQAFNRNATRGMAVLRPLRLIIDNYPDNKEEHLEAINNPEASEAGSRMLPFSRELYIERDDFRMNPPPKYFRLAPGREVRLMHAYLVTCESYVRDEDTGEIVEVHCRYDPESRGGSPPDGRKVKGTLHWTSARHSVPATVRLYDHLFRSPHPEENDFLEQLNPDSIEVLEGCMLEVNLADPSPTEVFQFVRHGYFVLDRFDSAPGHRVFNQAVSLKDTWARIERRQG